MQQPAYIEFTRAEVAQRARRLWNAAGRPDDRHFEFWLEAELEILVPALAALRSLKAAARRPRLLMESRQRHTLKPTRLNNRKMA